jgi:hypothetical protein
MYHYYEFNQEFFLQRYHKRSNVESTFSMIKAKFGDGLRSKTQTAQTIPKARNPRKMPYRNEPTRLREELYRIFEVDLTQIPDQFPHSTSSPYGARD